jgi:hypothetical protein
MIDYFTQALATIKRGRRWLRVRFTGELVAGAVTVAATSRFIETGRPWWAISMGILCIFAWAVTASKTARRIDEAGDAQDKLERIIQEATNAAGLLRDIGFSSDIIGAFMGPAATRTSEDEDPDATPSPTPADEPSTPRT